MKSKPLPIHHKTHVGPDFSIRPKIERFLDNQIADAIISFHQLRDFRRRLRCRHVLFGLRRSREKSHPRHVLRQHRHQRQPERLINIRDEFVARQIVHRTAIRQFLLERQMPVLIALVPPQILQAAPELMRLLDPPHFLSPRGFRFERILLHQSQQRRLQTFRQLFVVRAVKSFPRGRRRAIRAGCSANRTTRCRVGPRHRLGNRPFYRHKRRICRRNKFLNGHSILAFRRNYKCWQTAENDKVWQQPYKIKPSVKNKTGCPSCVSGHGGRFSRCSTNPSLQLSVKKNTKSIHAKKHY